MRRISLVLLLFLAASCAKTNGPSAAPLQPPKDNAMLTLTSSAFAEGEAIPEKYTCKGENINPPLNISGVPQNAKSVALILHDPDAPMAGGFTHWVIYNMPAQNISIAENSTPPGTQGLNGSGKPAYTGPCPPSGTHHYYFYVYALDEELNFAAPPDKAALEKAMEGHVVGQGQLMGTFAH